MATHADLARQGFDLDRLWCGLATDPRSLVGDVTTREHPLEVAAAIYGLSGKEGLSHLWEGVARVTPTPAVTPVPSAGGSEGVSPSPASPADGAPSLRESGDAPRATPSPDQCPSGRPWTMPR